MTLPVSEVFGPVFQGEGPHTGLRVGFLRLGLCNLRCSWCDTPYTWDHRRFDVRAECPDVDADALLARIEALDVGTLVLSGGEPLIHQASPDLRAVLGAYNGEVHVETNGTLEPQPWLWDRVSHFSVSPKLANGGDSEKRRIVSEVLRFYAVRNTPIFKFVCRDEYDLTQVSLLTGHYRIPGDRVWIMPEGTDRETVLRYAERLAGPVAQYGWNLTLRQHVLLYGSERLR